jgi:hypothetical protein
MSRRGEKQALVRAIAMVADNLGTTPTLKPVEENADPDPYTLWAEERGLLALLRVGLPAA